MSLLGKKKDEQIVDPLAQVVRVHPNDVIVIKSDTLLTLDDGAFDDFIASIHERFPESLIVLLGRNDTFETEPPDVVRSMLEDLIAHQEAVSNL